MAESKSAFAENKSPDGHYATVHPSPCRGIVSDGELYVQIDHNRLDVLIGELMELFDILPKDQGTAIKKKVKKISREWLDGYYNNQILGYGTGKSPGIAFYGYNNEKGEHCYVAALDEILFTESKQVPAFKTVIEAQDRNSRLWQEQAFEQRRKSIDLQEVSDLSE